MQYEYNFLSCLSDYNSPRPATYDDENIRRYLAVTNRPFPSTDTRAVSCPVPSIRFSRSLSHSPFKFSYGFCTSAHTGFPYSQNSRHALCRRRRRRCAPDRPHPAETVGTQARPVQGGDLPAGALGKTIFIALQFCFKTLFCSVCDPGGLLHRRLGSLPCQPALWQVRNQPTISGGRAIRSGIAPGISRLPIPTPRQGFRRAKEQGTGRPCSCEKTCGQTLLTYNACISESSW